MIVKIERWNKIHIVNLMIPAKLVQKSMQIHLANKLLQKYPVKACIVNGVHKKILADRNYALPLGQITHVFGL